jgi:hypothetical protein
MDIMMNVKVWLWLHLTACTNVRAERNRSHLDACISMNAQTNITHMQTDYMGL